MASRDILLEPRARPAPHKLADPGGTAVLLLTLGLFVAPTQLWRRLAPDTVPLSSHVELRVLGAAALLSLVLPLIQIYLQIRDFGGTAIRSNRVGFPAEAGAGGRVARAHRNLIESLVPFGAGVLATQAFGISNVQTVTAAILYLAARLVHALTYAFGITVLRSAAFYAGLTATVLLILQLPLFG